MAAMDEAITALEQFLKDSNPDVLAYLQPGLTNEEIASKVSAFPFRLPEEVFDLYRWRNGTRLDPSATLGELGIWLCYHFLSLEDSISTYLTEAWKYDPRVQKNWFPLLSDDGGGFYFVECSDEERAQGYVVDHVAMAAILPGRLKAWLRC
jgi:cell wall assembly regulator SMI1